MLLLLTFYWPTLLTYLCTNEGALGNMLTPWADIFQHQLCSMGQGAQNIQQRIICALISMTINSFHPISSMVTWCYLPEIHENLMRAKVLSIEQYSCEKWPRQKMSVVNVLYALRFSASEKWVSGSEDLCSLFSVVHCRISLPAWTPEAAASLRLHESLQREVPRDVVLTYCLEISIWEVWKHAVLICSALSLSAGIITICQNVEVA